MVKAPFPFLFLTLGAINLSLPATATAIGLNTLCFGNLGSPEDRLDPSLPMAPLRLAEWVPADVVEAIESGFHRLATDSMAFEAAKAKKVDSEIRYLSGQVAFDITRLNNMGMSYGFIVDPGSRVMTAISGFEDPSSYHLDAAQLLEIGRLGELYPINDFLWVGRLLTRFGLSKIRERNLQRYQNAALKSRQMDAFILRASQELISEQQELHHELAKGGKMFGFVFNEATGRISIPPIQKIPLPVDFGPELVLTPVYHLIRQTHTGDSFTDLLSILRRGFEGNGGIEYANTVINDGLGDREFIGSLNTSLAARPSAGVVTRSDTYGIEMAAIAPRQQEKPNWRAVGRIAPELMKTVYIHTRPDVSRGSWRQSIRQKIDFYQKQVGSFGIPVVLVVEMKDQQKVFRITPGTWENEPFDLGDGVLVYPERPLPK